MQKDNEEHKLDIVNHEQININVILQFLNELIREIGINIKESRIALESAKIKLPTISEDTVEYNEQHGEKLRDFLLIKDFFAELEAIKVYLENYGDCNNNSNTQ